MNKKKALSIVLAVVLALSVYSEVAVAQFGGGGAFGDCANYLKVLGTSIIPNKTATYNLGSASKTFNTIYAGTMSVSNYVIATGGYVGLGAAKGRIVFTDAATDTINLTGGTTQIDELEITNGNITYVPISGDISTYITAATAGDTLVLAAGTYTITSGITVNKKLHIMGQGEGITTIYATGASADFTMISIASSGSRMSNMTIKNDGAVTLTTKGMVEVNSNCDISNIDFLNAATGVGSVKYYSIIFSGAFTGNIENCTGTASGDIGIHAFVYMHVSGATANIRNCKASGSAGDASGLGNIVLFIGSPGGTVNVYNSIFSDSSNNTGAVVYQTTSGGVTNIYNSTINGSGTGAFDVFQSAGTITLYNTTLVNNTTSGDVIQKGTIRTDGVTQRTNSATATVAPTLTQSKSSSATIDQIVVDGEDCGKYAANGCAASGSYQPLGYILWEVDGTPGAGTDMPGRMSIWTSPDGTATPVERMRIGADGLMSGQVLATQNTHSEVGNLLNDLTTPITILGFTNATYAAAQTELGNENGAGRVWTYVGTPTKATQGNAYVWTQKVTTPDAYLTTPDTANMTFTDCIMSVGGWVNVVAGTTIQTVIGKFNQHSTGEDREWVLQVNDAEKLTFQMWEESTNKYAGQLQNTAMAAGWHFVVATGAGVTDANVVLYVDGVAVASTGTGAGPVTAMEGGATLPAAGANEIADGTVGQFFTSSIGRVFVSDETLSAATIWKMYEKTRGYYNK